MRYEPTSDPVLLRRSVAVAERLIGLPEGTFGDEAVPIAFVDRAGRLGMVAVFTSFDVWPDGNTVEGSWAVLDRRAMTRSALGLIATYAFGVDYLCCVRSTSHLRKGNDAARSINERLGMRFEGSHLRGWLGRETALTYGLLWDECKYLPARERQRREAFEASRALRGGAGWGANLMAMAA